MYLVTNNLFHSGLVVFSVEVLSGRCRYSRGRIPSPLLRVLVFGWINGLAGRGSTSVAVPSSPLQGFPWARGAEQRCWGTCWCRTGSLDMRGGLNSPISAACPNNKSLSSTLQYFTAWLGIFGCPWLIFLAVPVHSKCSLKPCNSRHRVL